jgi:hypothetical protein
MTQINNLTKQIQTTIMPIKSFIKPTHALYSYNQANPLHMFRPLTGHLQGVKVFYTDFTSFVQTDCCFVVKQTVVVEQQM